MQFSTTRSLVLAGLLALPVSASLSAQPQDPAAPPAAPNSNITVYGQNQAGPEVKGLISARNGDKIKVTTADG
ncbi:MAG TPA: OmpA family protein, partial [Novosphingobium sp.]